MLDTISPLETIPTFFFKYFFKLRKLLNFLYLNSVYFQKKIILLTNENISNNLKQK